MTDTVNRSAISSLTDEFRDSLKRTADWLENLLSEQRAGPGEHYTQPRTIEINVWDNSDAGAEAVDGFTFDDGEVEFIIGLIRAALTEKPSSTTERIPTVEELLAYVKLPEDMNTHRANLEKALTMAHEALANRSTGVSPESLTAIQSYVQRLLHSCPTNPEIAAIAIELNALLDRPSASGSREERKDG